MDSQIKGWIRLHDQDNCLVALRDLLPGESIFTDAGTFVIAKKIPSGHKVATTAISVGQSVLKYGWPIGVATQSIACGDHIHDHNLKCEHVMDHADLATQTPAPPSPVMGRTFEGYRRPTGKVGTRNYIGILSTVNCSASVSKYIANHFTPDILAAFPHVDGVVAFKHDSGCGLAYEGIKHRTLSRVMGGIAKHPNIGAYVLIGLGCEQNTLGHLMKSQRLVSLQWPGKTPSASSSSHDIPILSMQDMGGTAATVKRGIELVKELLPRVNASRRETVPASEIMLATKCGGSDGYSGITANPALGIASDLIVACGGTSILSETTELYGAEQLFTKRAANAEVASKLLRKLEWWIDYTKHYGEEFDNNPSLGNKAGGLTTIVEKSLGAATKGGSTALQEVYEYAESIDRRGLVIMDSPGFDPVCVTGMVASGANVVVFTTGRGSCFGCKPVPSVKVSTNSALQARMPGDIDLDMGTILGGESLEAAGHRLFEAILDVASGKKTKSEELGIGDEEFCPWSIGPTL
jgi:altronate hydrolase